MTPRSTPWTPTEDAIIREHYPRAKSMQEILPLLPGRTYNAIRTRANARLGFKMKKLPTYNKTCFSVPTELNCCIAGFLAADGHISDKGRLAINLASKDRDHLVTIAKVMGYTGRIYDYTKSYNLDVKKYGKVMHYDGTQTISTMQIQCPEAAAHLKFHWNITPRKTHTLSPPNLTDLRLVFAYLSGFIDGDGWIIEDKHNAVRPAYSIAIIGTQMMLDWMKAVFDQYVPTINPRGGLALLQSTESTGIYDYKVSGVKVYWLTKLFLSLDIPRLERKWSKLRRLTEAVESGRVSQRFSAAVAAAKPSDEVLTQFGLLDDAKRLLATIRPSVK